VAVSALAPLLQRMFGTARLPDPTGLLHVAAVWCAPDGSHVVMKIGSETPRSTHDFFSLQLARARADAIVITGKILRAEPELQYTLFGEHRDDLANFRRARGGRDRPTLLVLSSGRGLDLTHPALHEGVEPLVFTGPAFPAPLLAEAKSRGIEVIQHEHPSLRAAVAELRARGHASVSLEAGPSTVVPEYGSTDFIDELMLSIYEGPSLPPHLHAGPFVDRNRLDALFGHSDPGRVIEEPSGPWRFCRWRRRPSNG
jgi:riboflavin biosynthesis pyrimidine reductase